VRFLAFFLVCSLSWGAKAPKQGTLNGSVEAGFSVGSGPLGSQWLVDQLEWNQRFDASERVRFYFNNAVALFSPSSAASTVNNSVNYFSSYRLSGNQYTLANSGAYLEMRVSEGLGLSVGHLKVPFGLESKSARYDSLSYFYSTAFTDAQNSGWLWDLGMQAEISHWIPGTLKLALLDGRKVSGELGPAFVGQYEFSLEGGLFTVIPTFSAYVGEFQGEPKDLGFSVATEWLLGRASLNVEFLVANLRAGTSHSSLYVEPSADFGFFELGAKAEMLSDGTTNDFNVALAVTKKLPERLRLRLLYQAAGLAGAIRANQHDVRLLLGAEW
jgi:hypothetical protein